MGTVERIMERVSLPVEHQLWQAVRSDQAAFFRLRSPNSSVLLIGTDPKLTLARCILEDTASKITIIEQNPLVVAQAQILIQNMLWLSSASRLTLIPETFPNVSIANDWHSYDVIIAKHLLHITANPNSVLSEAMRLLKGNGVFFASLPPIARFLVEPKLAVPHKRQPLPGFFSGTLLTFRKS